MVFLGFGKYARADRIYALQPITGDDRGGGRRTLRLGGGDRASRSSPRAPSGRSCTDMGQDAAAGSALLDEALAFAERARRRTPTRAASTSPTSAAAPSTSSRRAQARPTPAKLF